MKIKYLGKKRVKYDTVTGSRYTWGPGDTVDVTEPDVAAQLLKYADIWVEVKPEPEPEPAAKKGK